MDILGIIADILSIKDATSIVSPVEVANAARDWILSPSFVKTVAVFQNSIFLVFLTPLILHGVLPTLRLAFGATFFSYGRLAKLLKLPIPFLCIAIFLESSLSLLDFFRGDALEFFVGIICVYFTISRIEIVKYFFRQWYLTTSFSFQYGSFNSYFYGQE